MAAVVSPETQPQARARLRLRVRGAVQGVGFRPFVYRLATEMGLTGWVNNSPQGVSIEVEGDKRALDTFILRLGREKPPVALIVSIEPLFLDPADYTTFEIRPSEDGGEKSALILPDIATCADCLRELFDPGDPRHLYPFTNCTNCGPRFTIIEALPYDRPNTTMKRFAMCERCLAEYEDPSDRRFHAQPNACPECGPHLELWSSTGEVLAKRQEALLAAAKAIRDGYIVALKGLGGFHLMVDARNEEGVARLRARKRREEKPLALMYPSLARIEEQCELSEAEARLLRSPESPIVLLHQRRCSVEIAPNVAPDNPYLGVMLPYTPLHHILMAELDFPVVATSGNLSDEPTCTDEREALVRLGGIADLFLVHNRPIARHVDDSVARVLLGREMVVRRARGYAPLPVRLPECAEKPERLEPLLAVGAHLKNSVALAIGRDAFTSQHIGDLETVEASEAFRRVVADFKRLYEAQPAYVACDLHPDYLSTTYAKATGLPVHRVQHHTAHIFACMAENDIASPVLGVAWDGTGYGPDGTVWGGEFLRVEGEGAGFERVAHLRTFRLPGGEKAVKEPRRAAIGVLHELFADALPVQKTIEPVRACTSRELAVWQAMIHRGVNAPLASSAGRLFDAVASLLGVRQCVGFEGQAAMALEFAIDGLQTEEHYPFEVIEPPRGATSSPLILDWGPMLLAILEDVRSGRRVAEISATFHNTLVEMIVSVARRAGEERVALTGGCFQNAYLLERVVTRLREERFHPYWHQGVPPNDGGIALGQIYATRIAVCGLRIDLKE